MRLRQRVSGGSRWTPEEEERLLQIVAQVEVLPRYTTLDERWGEIAARHGNERSASGLFQHYEIMMGKRKQRNVRASLVVEAGGAVKLSLRLARRRRLAEGFWISRRAVPAVAELVVAEACQTRRSRSTSSSESSTRRRLTARPNTRPVGGLR